VGLYGRPPFPESMEIQRDEDTCSIFLRFCTPP
jgi:hypothetical protein